MKVSRYYVSTIVFNDKLYAIGGMQNANPTNVVEVYDEETNAWKETANLKYPRGSAASFVVSEDVVAFHENNNQQKE